MEAFISAGAMGREKGLWCCWCLVLWLSLLLMEGVVSSELYNKTCTSQCGIITNISYPFRLPSDPPHCGDPDYELACENNVTLLHLNGSYRVVGTYRVVGINYHNSTIKLVDPGIQAGNCSSLPLYPLSLYLYDFHDSSSPYYDNEYSRIFKYVAYLNCSDPVRDDTAYVDTAPCVKGGGHLYAVVGDLLAHRFQPQCRLEFVTLIASDWESLVPDGIKSYADIHTLLSFGFELSWSSRACEDLNCPDNTYCSLSPENRGQICISTGCESPLGTPYEHCPKMPWLRIFAEDYLHGVIKEISILPQNQYKMLIRHKNMLEIKIKEMKHQLLELEVKVVVQRVLLKTCNEALEVGEEEICFCEDKSLYDEEVTPIDQADDDALYLYEDKPIYNEEVMPTNQANDDETYLYEGKPVNDEEVMLLYQEELLMIKQNLHPAVILEEPSL